LIIILYFSLVISHYQVLTKRNPIIIAYYSPIIIRYWIIVVHSAVLAVKFWVITVVFRAIILAYWLIILCHCPVILPHRVNTGSYLAITIQFKPVIFLWSVLDFPSWVLAITLTAGILAVLIIIFHFMFIILNLRVITKGNSPVVQREEKTLCSPEIILQQRMRPLCTHCWAAAKLLM
jgi:hypothetical protein